MAWKVVIAHADGEEHHAERVADVLSESAPARSRTGRESQQARVTTGDVLVRLPWSRRRKRSHGGAAEIRLLLERAGIELPPTAMSR